MKRGLTVTGGVITAAGLVLAGTFLTRAQIPDVTVAEVGLAVAIGVLVDTMLVRSLLVPALVIWLGDRTWWPARDSLGAGGQRCGAARFQVGTDDRVEVPGGSNSAE